MKADKIILCVLGAVYVLGYMYSRALFASNYIEKNGQFAYFFFGELSTDTKALLWPIFILFEL
jgi:hypothetical protein